MSAHLEDPKVGMYMTRNPHSIGADQSLDKAEELMNKYGFHHLPVLKAGQLKGVISDHDVQFAYRLIPHASALSVDRIMPDETYVVQETEDLSRVLNTMSDRRIGSALVVDKIGKLVGVFTMHDAVRAFADALDCQAPEMGEDLGG